MTRMMFIMLWAGEVCHWWNDAFHTLKVCLHGLDHEI